ncbi:hypothetical protein EVAR_37463_1 [Eumeta japonica]|uniref:Uncharacterized protein n=1 Tax=Eumeta variegata TaxID=151549 RepID=A0A4C1XFX8_EUMVA|nr:hypothetical protein EVAR_37463_1 [Eumeta japonica]
MKDERLHSIFTRTEPRAKAEIRAIFIGGVRSSTVPTFVHRCNHSECKTHASIRSVKSFRVTLITALRIGFLFNFSRVDKSERPPSRTPRRPEQSGRDRPAEEI